MGDDTLKLIYLLIPLFILSLVCVVSADIRVSPAEPVINGNGYVFVVFNNTSYASQQIYFNITDPNDVAKTSSSPTCNEYGYAKVIYNFTSDDIYGTWHYQTNTTDGNGDFTVGKIDLNVSDKYGSTSIGYGETTSVMVNLTYHNFLPKEILCTHQNRDYGGHSTLTGLHDFDDDGMPEIIYADSSGRYLIHKYSDLMNGGYPTWQSYDFGSTAAGQGFFVDDFDNDGNDVLVITDTTEVECWEISSIAGSTLNVAQTNKQTIEATVCQPVQADINGDDIPDQIAIMATDGSTHFYNYSEGSGFTQKLDSDNGAGTTEGKILVADFDSDGKNEYVAIYSDTGAWYFDVNHATGAVTRGDQAPDKGTYLCYGAVCDWDNDGKLEIILPLTSGEFQVLEFNMSGTALLEEDIVYGADEDQGTFSYGASQVQIADLNCNGRPDFISLSMTASTDILPSVYFNEYEPTGDTWHQELITTYLDTSYMWPTYCDFDGDGVDEIAFYARYNGVMWIYKYNGTGWEDIYIGSPDVDVATNLAQPPMGDAIRYGPAFNSGWGAAINSVVYDFDSDGKEEMIAFPNQGMTLIYQQEDRYERNTSPKLKVTVTPDEGEVANPYYEVRLLSTNETYGYIENIALGQTDILDDDGANQGGIASLWTDGILSLDELYYAVQAGSGLDYATIDASIVEDASWSQIDLQENYNVGFIRFWNYFSDNREFQNVKVWVGETAPASTLVFDNSADGFNEQYPESIIGKLVYFSPISTRYVRESTAGSNYYTTALNTANYRTEIEIYNCEYPEYAVYTYPLSETTLGDYYNVTVTVQDRYGTVIDATETLSYDVKSWNYSQDLAWKILNLTDTTILKLSEDGNLAIAGRLYELTNTPPPGNTVAFKIDDNLWLTESGDLYIEKELHEESNFIYYNIIATLVGICILVVNWRIRKRKV
jgi:hypothetical protein